VVAIIRALFKLGKTIHVLKEMYDAFWRVLNSSPYFSWHLVSLGNIYQLNRA